ncbi:MAG: 2-phospho-L-lactate guanylyltransferase [Phormidium sp. BM_Day4_Bin.17]|nr:2-phospho-L-lactate guanylyltransferase [Phormidium sp. BM_Day4_Bin.17]UCJ11941.1 MAG: 2-phospho-L-lactate guanylyltransferase [Phormidium sp. PBR-2020]
MNSVIVFEVFEDEDGGFVAECLTENIFTQGDSWDALRANVNEAVKGYYFDKSSFPKVKLHLVKEEMLVIQ